MAIFLFKEHFPDTLYRFSTAHIWACPPSEGDDYIFHCHPEDQKIPKPKRLTEWYRRMLDRGKSDSVVYEYRVSAIKFSKLLNNI